MANDDHCGTEKIAIAGSIIALALERKAGARPDEAVKLREQAQGLRAEICARQARLDVVARALLDEPDDWDRTDALVTGARTELRERAGRVLDALVAAGYIRDVSVIGFTSEFEADRTQGGILGSVAQRARERGE